MACYVNGVTPSMGNVQSTDSIGSGNSQPTSSQTFIDFKKMKDEAWEKFREIEQARMEEMEKQIIKEKERLEKELKKQTIPLMEDSYLFDLYRRAKFEKLPISKDMFKIIEDEVKKRISSMFQDNNVK